MKTIFLLTSLAFLLISTELFSACPTPLSWDYPNDPFTGEISEQVVLSVDPLCILHYKYCWRETAAYNDFAITEVSLEGDCAQFQNLDSLIAYASRDLITNHNPFGDAIPECPQMTPPNFRMSTAACFTDFYWDPVRLVWTSIPCGDDGQERWCWSMYRYCWYYVNGQQHLSIDEVSSTFGGPPCPEGTPYGLGCNQRCQ